MRITIVGAGATGTHLAKYMSGEQMDIIIVDKNAEKLASLDSEYNLMTIEGDGTAFATLRRADVKKCDLFIAVTDVAERNIVVCGMARSMGARRTVARVDRHDYMEPHNLEVLHQMGVDRAIFAEDLLAQGILASLNHSWTRNWYEFNRGTMIMAGLRLEKEAPLAGKYLRDLTAEERFFHIVGIRRQFETLIPKGDSQLMADDILYATVNASRQNDLALMAGKHPFEIRNVVIAGGGLMTELTVQNAPKQLHFTVIENNIEVAQRLAQNCPKCDVIVGETSEHDVLEEAGVSRADAFVALTESSEGNILSCLTARDMGVKKTIVYVDKMHFFNMAESFHFGAIINRQMLMANAMFQIMIDSGSLTSKMLALPNAEMIRLEVKAGTRITKAPIRELKIPAEITFAGMVRNGQSELVTGQTQLQEGDHLLAVCLQGYLQKAKKLFN
ncbi:MAG: Trk system potassium transporter TrkA [Bacteroidales bacterium]|nr:Trk system potassium transporter TrkA [Bacteroidales bacterium]